MYSFPAPERRQPLLAALGIVLALSGVWMLLPELIHPYDTGLATDRGSAEAAAARRSGAVLAAVLGAVRGDLWAEAAFTGARFMWSDRAANLDRANLEQLAGARANARKALALAPINGAAWLFLAALPPASFDREVGAATFLEMSYFTAPNDLKLAPLRIERAVTSNALADKDIQLFIKSDIRALLKRQPDSQQAIAALYRNAWPQNQPIFESLIADIDPATAQVLHPGPSK